MLSYRAYKTEIKPNKAQAALLRKGCGAARKAWNWGLGRRLEEYKETGKSSSAIDQHKQLNALKKTEFPWMYEVSKCAPQEALRDLDEAYMNFFRRVKNGEKPGFPRFKAKDKTTPSFRINSKPKVTETHILIPKVGWVRLKEHGYIPADGGVAITVRQSGGGRWFVSVRCGVEVAESKPSTEQPIGVDLGLKTFATMSDGTKIEAPNFLRKKEKKLKRAQRTVSRKKKGSNNRKKAVKRLAVQHYKVRCARNDFLQKESSKLVKTKPVLVFEDLNIKGMLKNHKLAKSIGDAGWGEFIRMCTYKAERVGGKVTKADRWFASSKTCCACGAVKSELSFSERVFRCGSCGAEMDRDLNAAKNLANYIPRVPRELTPAQSNEGRKRVQGRKFQPSTTIANEPSVDHGQLVSVW